MPGQPPVPFTAGAMTDADGQPVAAASHPKMELNTRLPVCAPRYSFLRKKRTVALSGHGIG